MPRGAKPKIYSSDIVKKVSEMYLSGMTQTEIGDELNISQKVVWNIMRRHGIKSRIAAKRNQIGESNSSWKGDRAGYQAMHRRLYAIFGKPSKCSICGTVNARRYDYANLTGKYEYIGDYLPMCRSCHSIYDKKIFNIKHMRRDADEIA